MNSQTHLEQLGMGYCVWVAHGLTAVKLPACLHASQGSSSEHSCMCGHVRAMTSNGDIGVVLSLLL